MAQHPLMSKNLNLEVYFADHIAWLLNTRPRKRFGFKTPQELMERELDGGLIRVALDS